MRRSQQEPLVLTTSRPSALARSTAVGAGLRLAERGACRQRCGVLVDAELATVADVMRRLQGGGRVPLCWQGRASLRRKVVGQPPNLGGWQAALSQWVGLRLDVVLVRHVISYSAASGAGAKRTSFTQPQCVAGRATRRRRPWAWCRFDGSRLAPAAAACEKGLQ